jgi:D-galactarolactone cycloisomerase
LKIVKLEAHVLSNKLKQSFFFSQWAYNERRICVVKITTDEGVYGWGEGYGPADVIQKGIALLEPLLMGKNPLENESLWFEMYRKTLDFARRSVLFAAISAIDIALWDIKGKALNLPVSTLLGGRHRNKVVPYATGLYFSDSKTLVQDLVVEAKAYVDQGFKAIKMKVGLSIKADIEHVKNVRKAIGKDIKLMVDSNHAYSLREAAELARKIESYDITWFEEPVSPEFYDQYSELRSKTSIPIAGGECEYLRYGFLQLLQNKSVDIAQVEICASGGLTEAKRIETTSRTAFKKGDWVMIPPYEGPALNDKVQIELGNNINFQLYNLAEDVGQQNNLAALNPEKLQEMLRSFEAIRGEDYGKIEKLELK